MPAPSPDVTTLLDLISRGDRAAGEQLYRRVYDELRAMARRHLGREHAATLPPTALVHEVWLRLADQRTPLVNRGQFFGIAAQAMRRILVDRARARHRDKRDGRVVTLDDTLRDREAKIELVVVVDDALTRLAAIAPRQARVVELRWFADLDVTEVAEALDISPATVKREWTAARAWLQRALAEAER